MQRYNLTKELTQVLFREDGNSSYDKDNGEPGRDFTPFFNRGCLILKSSKISFKI